MREEVDLEGDLVAVDGEGVTLGGGDGRVVDENVEARVVPYDGVGQVLDFLQTGEVGGERSQQGAVDALGGHQTVGCGLGLLCGTAMEKDDRAALGELASGLVADAGGSAGDEDGTSGQG